VKGKTTIGHTPPVPQNQGLYHVTDWHPPPAQLEYMIAMRHWQNPLVRNKPALMADNSGLDI